MTAWVLDNLLFSLAWKQSPLQSAVGMPRVGTAVTDACVWEKRRPDIGELINKPTNVINTEEVVSVIDRRCTKGHDHCTIEGAMRYLDQSGQ